jgi:hypothetical protein
MKRINAPSQSIKPQATAASAASEPIFAGIVNARNSRAKAALSGQALGEE